MSLSDKGKNMAEFWDIYDAERRLTGKLHRRGDTLPEGEYHLVVHIWVRNSAGDFLITKRADDKEPFPGKWECTGGSALAGENSEAAALRETREETGIDHSGSSRRCILPYRKSDWFGDVWLFQADFPLERVKLQKGETTAVRWASKSMILSMIEENSFCRYDYIKAFLGLV